MLIVAYMVKKRSTLYGNQKLITVFTKACYLSLSCAR